MADLNMEEPGPGRCVCRPRTPFEECVDIADAVRGNPQALIRCRSWICEMREQEYITGSECAAVIHHIGWLLDCCSSFTGKEDG